MWCFVQSPSYFPCLLPVLPTPSSWGSHGVTPCVGPSAWLGVLGKVEGGDPLVLCGVGLAWPELTEKVHKLCTGMLMMVEQ